jgi:serine/threonine protein kinase/Tfp pilus assembly protein PilF
MLGESLVDAAARIADGQPVDWAVVTPTLSSDRERAIADELEQIARIAGGHRQLHQLLPASEDTETEPVTTRARWGRLDLLNIVGTGSYGTVYRAWDTRLERLVALKLFHAAPNPQTVMQEGRMLARIRHEHVVTVYDADVIDGVAGIWMELVHGRTLDQILKTQGPIEPREAAGIGADVASALVAIHGAKLLHCDVKAQNVVREVGGRVVLMDFGAGRVMPDALDEKAIASVTGTPRYMAPELFQMGAIATRATDVYSLGVLLYYLVSGRFPVEGKSANDLREAHREGRVTRLQEACPDLLPSYVALVDQALDRDPAKRPPSASAIQTALAKIADPPVQRRTPLWTWLAAAASVAIIAFMVWQLRFSSVEVRSIGVLPIRNLTGDTSKAYLAEGLTEVLISNLARIRSLRVPGSASVVSFRDSQAPPAEIAKKLGVQLLLAGTITQADSRFKMAVQLIDPRTGVATWGEEISRNGPDMVPAQAEIARLVAERLGLALSPAENRALQSKAVDPRAQDAYLRALALRTTDPTAREEAARLFRQATEIDPSFAPAWAELALVEAALAAESPASDQPQRIALARQLAERALQLDATVAAGYSALGTIQFYDDWDFATAEKTFQTALTIDPNAAFPRQRLSMLLASRGRLDEAVRMAQEAVALEPLVTQRGVALGGIYYYKRDYAHAEGEARRVLQLSSTDPTAHYLLGLIAAARGQYDEAIQNVQQALKRSNYVGWLADLARIEAAAGRQDETRRILSELADREKAGEFYSPDNLGYIAAAQGQFDDAFRILNDALDRHSPGVLWIAVDPRVDPLRSDPRFAGLLKKLGLR